MTNQRAMRIAAVMGLLAVGLGAVGAHALEKKLAQIPNGIAIWDKAVFYHFLHAVMLFVLAMRRPLKRISWFAFLIGIILFSGSLYVYAMGGPHGMVYVTPIGGVSFLVGWICLILSPPAEAN